jgi:replicative DNA helicase
MTTGILAGYEKLDALTSGFQNGELIVINAAPSKGKTTFAVSLVSNMVIKQKKSAAYFSLEMPYESLHKRLLSSNQFTDDDIKSSPLFIDDTPHISISELERRARKLRSEHKVEIVFVDYLALITTDDDTPENERIGKIIVALKALAVEIGVPIIALHQLSSKDGNIIIPNALIENSDIIIHIHNKSDTKEWELSVSKRLTVVKREEQGSLDVI